MEINKIQFQKRLSMAGFMENYGTEDQCHAALVATRWPAAFVCPKCGGSSACVKLKQFLAVNTLLGNLKTTLSEICHAFDFSKYAHRYLAEFLCRFNSRFDLPAILVRLLRTSSVTSPYPKRLIHAAEHCG